MDALIRAARILDEFHTLRRRPRGEERSLPARQDAGDAEGEVRQRHGIDTYAPADADPGAGMSELSLQEQVHLQATREELEAARMASEKEGYAAGYEKGMGEARELHLQQVDQLRSVLEALEASSREQLSGVEDIAVDIAFEAACKILGAAMVKRAGVVAVVKEGIAKARKHEKIMVRVSPADLPLLSRSRSLLPAGTKGTRVDIVADDRVTLGGCLVETGAGSLDARLDIQLQLLRDSLLAAKRALPE